MGQKTNPISNRIGITRGWDSNWCGDNYAEKNWIMETFMSRLSWWMKARLSREFVLVLKVVLAEYVSVQITLPLFWM